MSRTNFLGFGLSASPAIPNAIAAYVPWTYFPTDDLYIRPSFIFFREPSSDCHDTEETFLDCDDRSCTTRNKQKCDTKGRASVGGSLGLGYSFFSVEKLSLFGGAVASAGRMLANDTKPADAHFHSERAIIECLIRPIDWFYFSFFTSAGVYCDSEKENCEFMPEAGIFMNLGIF